MSEQADAGGPDELRRHAALRQIAGVEVGVGSLAEPLALIAATLGRFSVTPPASPTLIAVVDRPTTATAGALTAAELLIGAGVNVAVVGPDDWDGAGSTAAARALEDGAQLIAVAVDVAGAAEQAAIIASLLGAGEPATLAPPHPDVATWTRSARRIRDAVAAARFRAADPAELALDAGAPAIAAAAAVIVRLASAGRAVVIDGPGAAAAGLVADALDGRVRAYLMVADAPGDRVVDAVAARLGLPRIAHAPISGVPGVATALAVAALTIAADLVVAASARGTRRTAAG